jgi:cytochrome P450
MTSRLGTPPMRSLVDALPLPETIADPYPLYAELREHTPCFGYRDYPPGTVPGQDEPVTAWVVMKYDDVAAAARDHRTFSSRDPIQEKSSAPTLMLVNHDDPEHERLRSLVNVAFSRREISALKPWAISCVNDLIDAVDPRDFDAVGAIASVLPARMMMHVLGCPDEDASRCRQWATAFMLSADLSAEQRQESNRSMVEYFSDSVGQLQHDREKGKALPAGLISRLLTAEVDGERLSLDDVVRFCVTLVVAGAETTTFLLANLLHNLATMPEVAAGVREKPDLVPAFLEETMRHSGPPQRLFRIATCDANIGSAAIRAGEWVALFFAAANHDPTVFPDPERFDPGRANLQRQLSMGVGIHNCLGSALARLEAAAMIEAVLRRYRSIRPGRDAPVPQRASLLTHGFESLPLTFES